jgi:predicted nucleotidyltransferase
MKQRIVQELDKIEKEHGIRILLASESGSRAWGFPSNDSDYDVRFIYSNNTDWYLSIGNKRDVVELPIDEILDINGWDLKKALQLMRKSNSPLLEWLSSPIKYIVLPEAYEKLLELSKLAFKPETSCHHYLAMARKSIENLNGDGKAKLKTYMYAIRPMLCCEWIIQHLSQPPMQISELLDELEIEIKFKDEVNGLIETKRLHSEKYRVQRSISIEKYINDKIEILHDKIPKNPVGPYLDMFDDTFRYILSELGP